MGEDSEVGGPIRYRAFVSYSHVDTRFAGWLHRKLEAWSRPGQARLTPIFIDHAELAAGPDLSAQVRDALAESAALIVVASSAARASRWVAQEINLFRELHPDRPVLAALLQGEPIEAFPEALLIHQNQAMEPLAADFREGHDGNRLGLLKIVAGLTAQPLDRLIQRDAQSRQRRVMAVTAGALLLSLVLAAMLVVALRARTEAEHQRVEAEGMVEFMLTDLRDKLKGVGRLDVMQAVNQRAMEYYGDQESLDSLPAASLQRRARVIEAMGEDDENGGRQDAALAKYQEIYRITSSLLVRSPSSPDRIFAHAQSENRLALIQNTRGEKDESLRHFRKANALLSKLPSELNRREWVRLRSYVAGNLCAMVLGAGGAPDEAIGYCGTAIKMSQVLSALANDGSASYDLAFHYLWLGDALAAAKRSAQAATAWGQSQDLSQQLTRRDPANLLWREQRMEINFHLAQRARADGQTQHAVKLLKQAWDDNRQLVSHDPANDYWKTYRVKITAAGKELDNDRPQQSR